MGCYGLRFRPAGAPERHVHPQRSALYQPGQREEGIFCLRGKEIWELGLWKLCCTVGLCRFVAPKAASFAPRRAGGCVDAGPAGRCGRFSCFAHAPLIKKSGQKRNHGLLWPALPSSRGVWGTRASAALRAVSVGGRGEEGIFWLRGKEILGWILWVGFVELVLCGGDLSGCCPEGRPRVP